MAAHAYRRRLADVDDDIEEAERVHDIGRLELAQRHCDVLIAELSRAVGLGGRGRRRRRRAGRPRPVTSAHRRPEWPTGSTGEHLGIRWQRRPPGTPPPVTRRRSTSVVRVRVVVAVVLLGLLAALAPARPAAAFELPSLPEPLVAMGDSFTAGEGSPPFESGTEDGCRRSHLAYPELVTLWRTTNLACGGATAATVLVTGQHGEPAQLARLPVDARRVVMTLGGNDLGFGEIILSCVVLDDCATGPTPPVAERLATLSTALPGVYRAVLDRAADAHLYVVEYPVLLPAVPVDDCLRLAGVSAGEQAWGRQVNLDLNRTIRHAVDAVAADHPGRITFVPTADRFAGHAVCDHGIDWVRGIHPVRAYSFHPNHAGQVGLALALRRAMAA